MTLKNTPSSLSFGILHMLFFVFQMLNYNMQVNTSPKQTVSLTTPARTAQQHSGLKFVSRIKSSVSGPSCQTLTSPGLCNQSEEEEEKVV